ncbi:PREDICTED: serine/threonine-protein phosphatase 7 long form homolog [Erythranthe guttata]|uniref:serine/threonine-protein phosphatase 7 long form homolog n=1 Tax=Erythranthe guttata TaxID=4155 RepID=UPI00064E07E1|nr:PREDICTED: serine/threonine-protein phosphatase 7 long form homolog [Erythranthe guttata]|eukprot:XP_012855525.1 PREDICTED: serine/threonine-protein phosphatase 7 long form homolog [Erythranthe guttata]
MSIFVQNFDINPVSSFGAIFNIAWNRVFPKLLLSARERHALVNRKVRRGDSQATRVDPPANRTRLPTDVEPSLSIPEDPPLTSTTEVGGSSSQSAGPRGPQIPDLMPQFENHIARQILSGKERESVRVHNHTTMLEKWRMTPFMTEVVERSGLMPLVRHSYKVIDSALVLTFIERWQPATCTFHLPFGEMTITLDDVSSLIGLLVVGRPVFIQQINKTGPSSQAIVNRILGVVLESTDKCWGQNQIALKLEWLRSTFIYVTDSDDENKKTCATRAFLLYVLSCTIFQGQDGKYGYTAVVVFVRRFGQYCDLRIGYSLSGEIEGPLVTRWVYPLKSDSSNDRARDLLTLIDDLSFDEIIWAPYEVLRDRFPMPESTWFSGMLQYMRTLEPYHPDRVLRQFGRVQKIPGQPYMSDAMFRKQKRGTPHPVFAAYQNIYSERWEDHLLNERSRSVPVVLGEPDTTPDYMDWYRERTITILSTLPVSRPQTPERHMDWIGL